MARVAPLVSSVMTTLLYDHAVRVALWPDGQVRTVSGAAGVSVSELAMLPFWSAGKSPDAYTGTLSTVFLMSDGLCPALLMHWYVPLKSAEAVTCSICPNHVAASLSPLALFVGPSAAMRFSGSFASSLRWSALSCWAPFCHASLSGTMWSIWMSELVSCPRTKLIVVPVYLSARVPDATTQLLVPGLNVSRSGRGRGCHCGCRNRCGPYRPKRVRTHHGCIQSSEHGP